MIISEIAMSEKIMIYTLFFNNICGKKADALENGLNKFSTPTAVDYLKSMKEVIDQI